MARHGKRCTIGTVHSFVASMTVGCAVLLASASASAQPVDARPWGKGTMLAGGGFGASFGPDIHSLSLGADFSYFVLPGLAVGLSLTDEILIYRDHIKAAFPGIEEQTPTNAVRLIPALQWMFVRSYRASPYIVAGVGPVFFNNRRGTIGQWRTGVGVMIGLGPMFAVDVGVAFMGNFPDDAWLDAYTYEGDPIVGCAFVSNPCSFTIAPRIGIAFGFGGSRAASKTAPAPAAPAEPVAPVDPVDPVESGWGPLPSDGVAPPASDVSPSPSPSPSPHSPPDPNPSASTLETVTPTPMRTESPSREAAPIDSPPGEDAPSTSDPVEPPS